jgi:hypothetical protein
MTFYRKNNTYAIMIPQVPNNSFNFTFNVLLPDGLHKFTFNWIWYNPEGGIQDTWYLSDNRPDGTVRLGAIYPDAVLWSQSPDMGIYFSSSLLRIGQNDLSKISMFALYWT